MMEQTREVMNMENTAQVRAYADDVFVNPEPTWTVECTVCGPLGISSNATVDTFAVEHMTACHGAEMVAR